MKLSRKEKIVNQVVLALFALFALVPLLGVVLSSLTPSAENFGGFALPSRLVFSNYADAWARGNFSVYMLSSVIVALSVVALTVLLSVTAGFAFARLRFVGSSVLFYLLLLGLMLPAEAFIIPLYFNLRGSTSPTPTGRSSSRRPRNPWPSRSFGCVISSARSPTK